MPTLRPNVSHQRVALMRRWLATLSRGLVAALRQRQARLACETHEPTVTRQRKCHERTDCTSNPAHSLASDLKRKVDSGQGNEHTLNHRYVTTNETGECAGTRSRAPRCIGPSTKGIADHARDVAPARRRCWHDHWQRLPPVAPTSRPGASWVSQPKVTRHHRTVWRPVVPSSVAGPLHPL